MKRKVIKQSNRVMRQNVRQSMRGNVMRGIVELVTNSDDSYRRLHAAGGSIGDGRIDIVRVGGRSTQSLVVRDFAEGMDAARMHACLGTYGGETSGRSRSNDVRGFWGRGLKDALLGLGSGRVISIRDGIMTEAVVEWHGDEATLEIGASVPAVASNRARIGIHSGNGTYVEIRLESEHALSQLATLRKHIQNHFELRGICADPARKVMISDQNKAVQPSQIAYVEPTHEVLLHKEFVVHGHDQSFRIVLKRSDVDLSDDDFKDDQRLYGLLVKSRGLTLDNTLFRYERNEYATRIYGELVCDHLDSLIAEKNEILTATRDGLHWDADPFMVALKEQVESVLEPFIRNEEHRAHQRMSSPTEAANRERMRAVLERLNDVASKMSDSLVSGAPGSTGSAPEAPEDSPSFHFDRDSVRLTYEKTTHLTIRAHRCLGFRAGTPIKLSVDGEGVDVVSPMSLLRGTTGHEYLVAKVPVVGRQIGAKGRIVARLGDALTADCTFEVAMPNSRRDGESQPRTPKTGFVKSIDFCDETDPKYRVKFDDTTRQVVIYTRSPSVSLYFEPNGDGWQSSPGSVFFAELLSTAVADGLSDAIVRAERSLISEQEEGRALIEHRRRIRDQIAFDAHRALVDQTHWRVEHRIERRGRPRKVVG